MLRADDDWNGFLSLSDNIGHCFPTPARLNWDAHVLFATRPARCVLTSRGKWWSTRQALGRTLCYTVLYCVMLCYTVLYGVILCYTVLYCVILCYTVLYCVILCYTVLYCVILCYTVLKFQVSVVLELRVVPLTSYTPPPLSRDLT